MKLDSKIKTLRIALIIIGLLLIFALYPLMQVSPGWNWMPPQYEYEQMILGIYITLGVFLLIAAKNPTHHLSLIWFTAWSSFIHAVIILIQALVDKSEHANLMGDIPALFILAIVLAILTPRRKNLPKEYL